jgi:YjbE family integral membrane protein
MSLAPVLHVIAVDLALSGDNTLVIGLAARGLPPRQRRWAVAGGTAAAVALRVSLTLVAAALLRVPYLHLVGGALLLAVAVRSVGEAEAGAAVAAPAPTGVFSAVATIVAADATMSLDNVLAVAAAAGEDPALVALGLALSVGLMAVAGNAVAALLGRVPWLALAAAAVVAWTGALLALRDPAVPVLAGAGGIVAALVALAAVGVPVLLHRWKRRRHAGRG